MVRERSGCVVGFFVGLLFALSLVWSARAAWFSSVPLTREKVEELRAAGELEEALAARDAYFGRMLHRRAVPAPPRLSVGERRAVVILVDFDDNESEYEVSHFEEFLFSKETYVTGSFRDYYLENSYGKLDVTGSIVGWYRMPHPYSYYANHHYGFGAYPQNAQGMVEDAVELADPDVDFAQFDNNHDGLVDMLIVVHAGPEGAGNRNGIWSHVGGTGKYLLVDGVRVYIYAVVPELAGIGVYCHEFGHLLGLPDLYDTDYSSSGVGAWTLMASGAHLNYGRTPAHLDAWSKIRLGWIKPVVVDGNLTGAELPAVEDEPVVYKLWRDGQPEKEYFLVENRQQKGFDSHLPGSGLLIYHVDDAVMNNRDEDHYKVGVEQADGRFDLEKGGWADAGDPFPGSSENRRFERDSVPNSRSYLGEDTYVAVVGISDSGERMTANLSVKQTEPELVLDGADISDEGDGDGVFSAGEAVSIRVRLVNRGYYAKFANATVASDDPFITITSATLSFPPIAKGDSVWSQERAWVQISRECPCPHEVRLSLEVVASEEYRTLLLVRFWVCSTYSTSFEEGEEFWEHFGLGKSKDQWHQSAHRNWTPEGLLSAKCGAKSRFDDYANSLDDVLVSPIVGMREGSVISFWHWLNSQTDAEGNGVDVGIVEGTEDGTSWFPLFPESGYPSEVSRAVDVSLPAGTPCFSGKTGGFQLVQIRCPENTHLQQVRFRFITNRTVRKEGWYIDEFSIRPPESNGPPVIMAGGFFQTNLYAETGGLFTVRVLVNDPDGLDDIERVELLYDGIPTGILLNDAGLGGDAAAADGVFTFTTEVPGGMLSSGQHLVSVVATDLAGNTSNQFPYLTVTP